MQTLKAFLNGNRISATCELIEKRPDALMGDMPAGSRHWRVTLRAERRRLTIYFSQGPAIEHAPTAEDVLDCLASDAADYDNARSFEEWCSEYGYDTDSRRAEQIWQAIKRQTHNLVRFLGSMERFNALLYETERL